MKKKEKMHLGEKKNGKVLHLKLLNYYNNFFRYKALHVRANSFEYNFEKARISLLSRCDFAFVLC